MCVCVLIHARMDVYYRSITIDARQVELPVPQIS
jgi:hypothetical protein